VDKGEPVQVYGESKEVYSRNENHEAIRTREQRDGPCRSNCVP